MYTIIKENTYQDSIALMLLSNKLNEVEGVNKAQAMMATPANKDILIGGGFETEEMKEAGSNDIVVVIDTDDESKVKAIEEIVDAELSGNSSEDEAQEKEAHNWTRALQLANKPNVALISIPGQYAAMEAENALRNGLNVFMFSDNVSKEDERRLKELAHEKGLLVMGPDSGTGVIHGVPLAFTNIVNKGNIGVVGASGTGIQEVTTIIDRLGGGVTNAIGTGGRDLADEIGAITMIDAIKTLNKDSTVDVITVISKPSSEKIQEKVNNVLRSIDKPIVVLYLGDKPEYTEENIYHAYTLAETAKAAFDLSNGKEVEFEPSVITTINAKFNENQVGIRGFYSGGTLASEAAMLIKHTTGEESEDDEAYVYKNEHHSIIDLGDDMYTQGKPHPMIDPENRVEALRNAAEDEEAAVILLDNVIGYGSHADMASELAPVIAEVKEKALQNGRELIVLATVLGTDKDLQGYESQRKILADSGAVICETNDEMVRTALHLIGKTVEQPNRAVKAFDKTNEDLQVSEDLLKLVTSSPSVINIGLKSFTQALEEQGAEYVQFNWRPIAGGDEKLMKVLQFLNNYEGDKI